MKRDPDDDLDIDDRGGLTEEEMQANEEHFWRNQAIDPRLTWQDEYLTRATLQWQRFHAPGDDKAHEHCEFCWATIDDVTRARGRHGPDCVHEAYVVAQGDLKGECWVCQRCYVDFKDRFEWTVVHGWPTAPGEPTSVGAGGEGSQVA